MGPTRTRRDFEKKKSHILHRMTSATRNMQHKLYLKTIWQKIRVWLFFFVREPPHLFGRHRCLTHCFIHMTTYRSTGWPTPHSLLTNYVKWVFFFPEKHSFLTNPPTKNNAKQKNLELLKASLTHPDEQHTLNACAEMGFYNPLRGCQTCSGLIRGNVWPH